MGKCRSQSTSPSDRAPSPRDPKVSPTPPETEELQNLYFARSSLNCFVMPPPRPVLLTGQGSKIALAGTIQFTGALAEARAALGGSEHRDVTPY